MGDDSDPSTPFLSYKDQKEGDAGVDHPLTLDARIEQCIGHFGWPQLFQSVLVSLSWAFDAQQCFISVFTDSPASPSNILSDWSLEDAGPFLTGLPASSFFIGSAVGGLLLTPLADSCLGRKNLLILSCLLMSLSGTLTAFLATNVYLYSALRFASGFGRASIGTCALVLGGELVGHRWRSHVGIFGFVLFALGFASLPGIAYLNRHSSWRNIYLWTSLPALLYSLAVYLFATESPRWLFVRGSKDEAVKILNTISSMPGRNTLITLSFLGLGGSIDESSGARLSVIDDPPDFNKPSGNGVYSAMGTLMSRKWCFRRLVLVMIIAFGLGIVYYGMPLGLGNLSFNLYLSVAMNAFMELPACLATFVLIGSMNRRTSLLATTGLSGVCSIASGAMSGSGWAQVGLEMVSFLSGTTALDVALIYTTELFPTCVRNSAVAMARQALVVGGAFGPVLAAAGRGDELVTYGVFGAVILVCGAFAVWLPETKGTEICDTMDEEECKLRETAARAGLLV